MQNLYNIERWRTLAAGEMATFESGKRRKVKLDVNAPDETLLFIQSPNIKEPVFLARVIGLEHIEFITEGSFELSADAEINIYSSEFEKTSVENLSPSLAKVMQRKTRNPELEEMFYRLQQNTDLRLAKQAQEFQRLLRETRATTISGNAEPATKPAGKSNDSGASTASDASPAGNTNPNEPAEPAISGESGTSGSTKGGKQSPTK